MGVPGFLLRKLYKRGSLCETADGHFTFRIHNPLANATLIGPPVFVINGIHYQGDQVEASGVSLADIAPDAPFVFAKGSEIELRFPGRLLRGGNRIHMSAPTTEFDDIEFLVEDKEATYCSIPGEEE